MTMATMENRTNRFLFPYRTTPHTTTGVSPAEFLRLKTPLDLARPGLVEHVVHRQNNQKETHDRAARARTFQVGDTKNYSEGADWMPAEIVEVTGPVSFKCRLADKRAVRKHQDQIRSSARRGREAKCSYPRSGV